MSIQQANRRWDLSENERIEMLRDLLNAEPSPQIQSSIEAFRRDLPELLRDHRGRWVAYYGDERLGIANSEGELYQAGFQRGLTRNEFVVGPIEPGTFDPDDELEVLHWDV